MTAATTATKSRQDRMIGGAVWLVEQGFCKIGWSAASDGKGPVRHWQADATDDPALVPSLLHGARNALVIPKDRGVIIDVDKPDVWVDLESAGLPPTLRIASPTTGHGHVYGFAPVGFDMASISGTFDGGEIRRFDPTTGTSSMVLGPWAMTSAGTYQPLDDVRAIATLPVSVFDYLRSSARRQDADRTAARGPGDAGWFITAGRHDFLVAKARNLRGVGVTDERLLEEVTRLDRERCRPPIADLPGRGVDELRQIVAWVMKRIADDPPEPTATTLTATSPRLPADFWTARDYLETIYQAARSRQRAPDAVLGAVLARVAAMCPPSLGLPPIVGTEVGLSLLVALVAGAGSGKSNTAGIARELVRPDSDVDLVEIPSGSGEGLAEAFFELVDAEGPNGKLRKEKRQVHHNVLCYVDEGQKVTRQAASQSSTLFATWRSAFSGATLGESNASADRHRVVPAGSYQVGILVAFQPEMLAPLFDDLLVGTPARFLYLSAIDPTLPDEPPAWPGPLDLAVDLDQLRPEFSAIRQHQLLVHIAVGDEIRKADLAKQRGEVVSDGWNAHRNLLRLKVAALLAIIDGRLSVAVEDWQLAGTIVDISDAVRRHAQAAVRAEGARTEAETSSRLARRAGETAIHVEKIRVVEAAKAMADKVWREQGGKLTRGGLRSWVGAGRRDVFGEAFDMAVAAKWIEERTEPGQGDDKDRIWPGRERP